MENDRLEEHASDKARRGAKHSVGFYNPLTAELTVRGVDAILKVYLSGFAAYNTGAAVDCKLVLLLPLRLAEILAFSRLHSLR